MEMYWDTELCEKTMKSGIWLCDGQGAERVAVELRLERRLYGPDWKKDHENRP